MPRCKEDRLEVHRHHPVPELLGNLGDRTLAGDAGVVDEDVQATVTSYGGVDHSPTVPVRSDIGLYEQCFPSASPDLCLQPFGGATTHVCEDQPSALLGEEAGYSRSDPLARAGDDRCSALQPHARTVTVSACPNLRRPMYDRLCEPDPRSTRASIADASSAVVIRRPRLILPVAARSEVLRPGWRPLAQPGYEPADRPAGKDQSPR